MYRHESLISSDKRKRYTHIEIRLLIFRVSYYKMRGKFSVRFEISKGWDK